MGTRRRIPGPKVHALLTALPLLAAAACRDAGSSGASPGSGQAVTTPNLLVIVVDDWAESDWEASRGDLDPWNDLVAIDTLAAQGQEWENFYAQPLCNPTRKTLTFGVFDGASDSRLCMSGMNSKPVPTETLGEVLRQAGYATAAFGKWHIGPSSDATESWGVAPREYGFDSWRALSATNIGGHCGSNDYTDWMRADDGVESPTHEYHTEAVGLAFMDWWQSTPGPRFAYVCFQAAHEPFHMPPAHLLPSGFPQPTSARKRYEAMLVAADSMVATMMSIVDLTDTYVILLGDNGTPRGAVRSDQDPLKVKWTTLEDGVHVPMVVAGPGVRVGTTRALGHVADLPATLAGLASTAAPLAMIDSVSLLPVFLDRSQRVRDSLICDRAGVPTSAVHKERDTCVVLDAAGALFKARYLAPSTRGGATTRAFFNLSLDPREEAPIDPNDPTYAARIQECETRYADFLDRGGSKGGFQ
ncbi:MAG TPA: hypothetical protein ENJ09_02105 [Planctomycetes bacterium]|nr:hypothetical protein [Planctomycetota bacterium]